MNRTHLRIVVDNTRAAANHPTITDRLREIDLRALALRLGAFAMLAVALIALPFRAIGWIGRTLFEVGFGMISFAVKAFYATLGAFVLVTLAVALYHLLF